MRLLLYEYLSAGGLPDAPRSLLREGWAMLAAFGNAKLAGRNAVLPEDVMDERVAKKARIGF